MITWEEAEVCAQDPDTSTVGDCAPYHARTGAEEAGKQEPCQEFPGIELTHSVSVEVHSLCGKVAKE
jgi:hypothetical protein